MPMRRVTRKSKEAHFGATAHFWQAWINGRHIDGVQVWAFSEKSARHQIKKLVYLASGDLLEVRTVL